MTMPRTRWRVWKNDGLARGWCAHPQHPDVNLSISLRHYFRTHAEAIRFADRQARKQ